MFMKHRLLHSSPKKAWSVVPLIRLMVGTVFLTEGVQKFIYPALRGAGRFAEMGFLAADFLGYFVGAFEVACGVLLLLGLFTRFAAAPLIVIMLTAIVTTKIPVLLGHGFGPFGVRDAPFYNFWSMAHEMRTDWAMLLGSVFLLIAGGGPFSLDVLLTRRSSSSSSLPPDG